MTTIELTRASTEPVDGRSDTPLEDATPGMTPAELTAWTMNAAPGERITYACRDYRTLIQLGEKGQGRTTLTPEVAATMDAAMGFVQAGRGYPYPETQADKPKTVKEGLCGCFDLIAIRRHDESG
jgi:hypothetical protein